MIEDKIETVKKVMNGRYLIKSKDGFALCQIELNPELVKRFNEKQLEIIASDVRKVFIERLHLDDTKIQH